MIFDAVLTDDANRTASDHLLHHYREQDLQEDLCFALWRPSTGHQRFTALVDDIILPEQGERTLHGNASFNPQYLARTIEMAIRHQAGIAFMHSHPGKGWQALSYTDINAERDNIAYAAMATRLPLLGMTIGSDGYWSARFWQMHAGTMDKHWLREGAHSWRTIISVLFQQYPCPSAG